MSRGFGWPGSHWRIRRPDSLYQSTVAELLFRAADQSSSSFSCDDRAQCEAEHHRGPGSDHNAGHHLGQENPDCDTENRGGRDCQRDIGRCRPRTVDRATRFRLVTSSMRSSSTRWKPAPNAFAITFAGCWPGAETY